VSPASPVAPIGTGANSSALPGGTFFRPDHGPGSPGYRMCSVTVMDTADPGIRFNDRGESQFVSIYRERTAREILRGEPGRERWNEIVRSIRRGRESIDCICGVSGGVDSSLVLLRAVQAGLKPLAVHMDNGWNDELAVANIERLTHGLGVELHTEVLDWESFRGLQRAFFRASVPNVEMVTDHAINATLFRLASSLGVPRMLSGSNLATEAFLQTNAGHDNKDWTHIRALHRRFGDVPIGSYPYMSKARYAYAIALRGVRFIPALNYLDYDRDAAKRELAAEHGWRDYGRKHGESAFTRFFQEHYLPVKFGIDKRRAHLSCQILAGQLTREQALLELEKPLWAPGELEPAVRFACRKLGFDDAQWRAIMAAPPLAHDRYPTDWAFRDNAHPLYQMFRRLATGRGSKQSPATDGSGA